MSARRPPSPRVAVLGAGPIGLDAALAALEHGFPVRVYEAALHPAGGVRSWGHVELFSPWSMNVSGRMRRRLEEIGRPLEADEEAHHSGHEYADRVLDPLWGAAPLSGALRLGRRVVAVGRDGILKHEEIGTSARGRRPFRILTEDADGRERVEHADVVLDCTGKYGNPNTLGDGGIPAPGERALSSRIQRRIPDVESTADEWRGTTVLLAGAGHSAQTAARALAGLGADSGTRVLWLIRSEAPSFGAVPDDPLRLRRRLTDDARMLAAGSSPVVEALLGASVDAIEGANGRVRVRVRRTPGDGTETLEADRIVALTGGVGDDRIYRQLQVHECYATSGPMKLAAALLGSASEDCLEQPAPGPETLSNPEPHFFLLGDKSYGRNNTFLLRTGFRQVDDAFALITG